MTRDPNSLYRRFQRDDSAAVAALAALGISAVVGLAALVVDIDYYFSARSVVQASANAAALAGAQQIGNGGNPVSTATQYSSVASGDKNYVGTLSITMVSGYPALSCASTWATNAGVACSQNYITSTCTTAPCSPAVNLITVAETTNVPTFFGRLFGMSSIPLTATATASAQGSVLGPWNVALIVDTTASMGGAPTGQAAKACSGFGSAIDCAIDGAQVLLSELWPCASGLSSCTGATPLDEAALFVFPPLTNPSQAQLDYTCSHTNPQIATTYSGVQGISQASTTTTLNLSSSSMSNPWGMQVLTSGSVNSANMSASNAFNSSSAASPPAAANNALWPVVTDAGTPTNQATGSTSAVLHFPSGVITAAAVAKLVGLTVQDTTSPGAIPAGTKVSSASSTGNTVTMSANAHGSGVQSGDLITFGTSIPAGTGSWPWWGTGTTVSSVSTSPAPGSLTLSAAPTGAGVLLGDNIIVGALYQIVGFGNDYRSSDTASLNTSSSIVKATNQGCLSTPGGLGTYYADAINVAQHALVAVQSARVAAGNQAGKNVIILLSDAAAASSAAQMGPLEAAQATYECGAAVVAAQNAAKAGTTVYGIYFDDGSPSCSDTAIAPGLSSIITSSCTAMQLIANAQGPTAGTFVNDQPKLFYSADGTSAPCKSSQPYTSIHQIFQQLVATLTKARLVPVGTT
jgi:hypothetical protein